MQTELIKQEIDAAAEAGNILFENHKFIVVHANAPELTQTLPVLGRLREVNFRMVGEGTGKEIDLDEFDERYIHIIAWNKKHHEILGAVRVGETFELYQQYGKKGIYSCGEFDFDEILFEKIKTSVEMSRLFVNVTGQKNYFGLYLVFSGLANWLIKNQQYTHLFGSVSISKTIPAEIHGLIIAFCRKNYFDTELSQYVHAYKPASFNVPETILAKLDAENPADFDELDKFIETHYGMKNQVPILFKKYHLFSANYLAFGIDDDFSSVTDPLIHCNITGSDPKVFGKFIDKKISPNFLEYFDR